MQFNEGGTLVITGTFYDPVCRQQSNGGGGCGMLDSMKPRLFYFVAKAARGWSGRHGHPRMPAAIHSFRPVVESLEERTLLAGDLGSDSLADEALAWGGHARDPQHTALSPVASQPLEEIAWQTPVDLAPQYAGGSYLLIHYGSPLVTEANTVIVPVKTGASGGFRVEGRSGENGALKWTQTTDYVLPPHGWVPSFTPVITPANRLYYAGAGGTVYYVNSPDANGASTSGQFAFYGLTNYTANKPALDATVFINTPITSDSDGNIFFGFRVTGPNPANLESGIARIDPAGNGTWISASAAAGDAAITAVAMNSAPALSNDGQTLYVAVSGGNTSTGYLVALESDTLSRIGASGTQVRLKDPNGNDALIPDNASASPTIGPDGHVYFGVFESPLGYNHYRGWLLHFSADLSQTYVPGAFGWDDTASVVPATMVPSYTGTSSYLLMTKYNDYPGGGGQGLHELAIIDPTQSMTDPVSGQVVMKEVLTIAGVTPDHEYVDYFPNAVREWCTNTSVVDPSTGSILANSADGKLYRWDLSTNTLSERITLTAGLGEAYTPTIIGVDGTVYAINNATLFAVRGMSKPDPTPWHNSVNALDVSFDGNIAPDDVLLVINYLNTFGSVIVPATAASDPPYYDVTRDNRVEPDDALNVINFLNTFGSVPATADSALHATSAASVADLFELLAEDLASQPKRRR